MKSPRSFVPTPKVLPETPKKRGQAGKAKVPPYTQSSRPKPKFNRAAEQIARYEAKPNRRKKSADVPRQKPVKRKMIP